MWISKSEYEKLQARVAETDKWRRNETERAEENYLASVKKEKEVYEAVEARRKAEAALEAATRISYVVAHHRNDAAAVTRYATLERAVDVYQSTKSTEHRLRKKSPMAETFPLFIFALRGDDVIADVTDPAKWNETLPISDKRPSGQEVYERVVAAHRVLDNFERTMKTPVLPGSWWNGR